MAEKHKIFEKINTQHPEMLNIFSHIEAIANSPYPVLVTGETGVGKECIAKAIHQVSKRTGSLVAVNVAGLDENVFSDTLFGHKKGAFTGANSKREGLVELAKGGTLIMDEVGDLSLVSQVKLLRFLQEEEYYPLGADSPKKAKVRIVAVTNRNLWELQNNGEFRKDLNFRLRTHHIDIPALRDRKEDIPLLVACFLQEAADAYKRRVPTVPSELHDLLYNYSFPGNVRELKGMIYDAVSRYKSKTLSINGIKTHIMMNRKFEGCIASQDDTECRMPSGNVRDFPTLKEATQLLIDEAMKRSNGNITQAAIMLGISRQALSKRQNSRKSTSQFSSENSKEFVTNFFSLN